MWIAGASPVAKCTGEVGEASDGFRGASATVGFRGASKTVGS